MSASAKFAAAIVELTVSSGSAGSARARSAPPAWSARICAELTRPGKGSVKSVPSAPLPLDVLSEVSVGSLRHFNLIAFMPYHCVSDEGNMIALRLDVILWVSSLILAATIAFPTHAEMQISRQGPRLVGSGYAPTFPHSENSLQVFAQNTPLPPPRPDPSQSPAASQLPSTGATSTPAAVRVLPTATTSGEVAAGPTPPGVVREKETKETKEIRDGDWGWPITAAFLGAVVLCLLAWNRAIQQLFGVAVSVVQKIEIAGVKLEIDSSRVREVKRFLGGSLAELIARARSQYDQMAAATSVQERLKDVVRIALRDVLTQQGFASWPEGLRAAIHVPDVVFKDYMYQLVNYYPNTNRPKTAGRRLSQRLGIVGRSWRLRQSMGRGRAISGPDASNQLVMFWGMQRDEADDQSHLIRPALLCVILIDDDDDDNRVGILYIDSTAPDAFGLNPPLEPVGAIMDVATTAAKEAAEMVVRAAADAAVGRAADPVAYASSLRVVRSTERSVPQAVNDAVAQATSLAASRAHLETTAHEAATAAAQSVAQAANDAAAHAASDAAAAAVAQATNGMIVHAADQAAAAVLQPQRQQQTR
jgi:hypothetical protein